MRAVRLFQHLQQSREGAAIVIGRQYLRSATSIGADLVEAQSGESRRDFLHRQSIAQKEARESPYWLRLLQRAELMPATRLPPLLEETDELIAIIPAIIARTKANRETEG